VRFEEGVLLVDGPVLLREAVDSPQELESVYVEREGARASTLDAAARAEDAGVRVVDVVPGTLASVLELTTPQAVVTVVRRPTTTFDDVVAAAVAADRPVLVLAELADPGNVGTLVRVAEAAGCAGVVMSERSADPYSPKAVRASAGSVLRVPVVTDLPVTTMLDTFDALELPQIGTLGTGGELPEDLDLADAFALWLGSEAHGLPAEVVTRCTHRVTIPMDGRVESLNAAVAGSVVVFDAARQRRIRRSGSGIGVAG
jgi:TrmH family RNA methyltransferase